MTFVVSQHMVRRFEWSFLIPEEVIASMANPDPVGWFEDQARKHLAEQATCKGYAIDGADVRLWTPDELFDAGRDEEATHARMCNARLLEGAAIGIPRRAS